MMYQWFINLVYMLLTFISVILCSLITDGRVEEKKSEILMLLNTLWYTWCILSRAPILAIVQMEWLVFIEVGWNCRIQPLFPTLSRGSMWRHTLSVPYQWCTRMAIQLPNPLNVLVNMVTLFTLCAGCTKWQAGLYLESADRERLLF